MTAPFPTLFCHATAGAHDFDVYDETGRSLALIRNRDESSAALAALFTTAPALLSACEALVDALQTCYAGIDFPTRKIDTAYHKARAVLRELPR